LSPPQREYNPVRSKLKESAGSFEPSTMKKTQASQQRYVPGMFSQSSPLKESGFTRHLMSGMSSSSAFPPEKENNEREKHYHALRDTRVNPFSPEKSDFRRSQASWKPARTLMPQLSDGRKTSPLRISHKSSH